MAAKRGEEVRFRELAQATIRGFFSFSDEAVKQRGGEAFVALAIVRERVLSNFRKYCSRDPLPD